VQHIYNQRFQPDAYCRCSWFEGCRNHWSDQPELYLSVEDWTSDCFT